MQSFCQKEFQLQKKMVSHEVGRVSMRDIVVSFTSGAEEEGAFSKLRVRRNWLRDYTYVQQACIEPVG